MGRLSRLLRKLANYVDDDKDYDYDYDDDWGGESDDIIFKPSTELIRFAISEKMIRDRVDPNILLKNSWLYIYGYCDDSPIEKTMCMCEASGNGTRGTITETGIATRFEFVSNEDLFYYGGGSIGSIPPHPLAVSNVHLCIDSVFTIDHITLGVER